MPDVIIYQTGECESPPVLQAEQSLVDVVCSRLHKKTHSPADKAFSLGSLNRRRRAVCYDRVGRRRDYGVCLYKLMPAIYTLVG